MPVTYHQPHGLQVRVVFRCDIAIIFVVVVVCCHIYCNYYCYYTLPSPSPLNPPLGQALSMRMLQGAKVCIRLTSHLPLCVCLCVSGLWNVPQVRRTRDPSQVTAGAIQSLGSAIIHSIPLPAPLHPEGARCIPVPPPMLFSIC